MRTWSDLIWTWSDPTRDHMIYKNLIEISLRYEKYLSYKSIRPNLTLIRPDFFKYQTNLIWSNPSESKSNLTCPIVITNDVVEK
jgi:hypothetical protein